MTTGVATAEVLSNANFKLKTDNKRGGAVTSIMYHGTELINTNDNGRLLQSAVSYDNLGEACNPTQGGDITNKPTSKIEMHYTDKADYKILSISEMAYWWSDGRLQCTRQNNHLSVETSIISPHTILSNVTYTVPANYSHATFEALTGYLNHVEHSIFFDPATQISTDTGTFIGEQSLPVIHHDFSGILAVGVFSPALPQNWHGAMVGYGRFFYTFDPVKKFNCVFREDNLKKDEVRTFQCMTVVGTLDEVKAEITRLYNLYKK